jgi:RHS repeat-associated protein
VSAPISVTTAGGTGVSAAAFQIVSYVALTITPDPASVDVGASLQLTARGVAPDGSTSDVTAQVLWSSAGSAASVSAAGLVRGLAAGTTTITATLGTLARSITLTVRAPQPLPPDPATIAPPLSQHGITGFRDGVAFLYTGTAPIQTGVAPGTISDERVAVIRGRVTARDGSPLPGARVCILGRPELGETLSRIDGMFDLAVNGGGALTVVYEKSGYLSSQRTVNVPWLDFVWTPEVALVQADAAVTVVDLASPRLQVARGSAVTDRDGTRQATLLFPAGTTASLVLPDGTTRPAMTLRVRATEYTIGARGPQAMPATLPPNVAYTYCVDLQADEAAAAGATSVLFSKPVSLYFENYLGVAPGTHIPLAAYDSSRARWMPEDDGRVVRILSITGGAADLDTNGDGLADDATRLAALGIDDAERQQLASLYTAGQTVWRLRAPHFTPYDANFSLRLPGDAAEPDLSMSTASNLNESCHVRGSIIDCENQTLGEVVPITGSPFSLIYNSGRVLGRAVRRGVDVDVRVPPSAASSSTTITVAGQQLTFQNGAGNTTNHFDWDGRDAYGRQLTGSVPLHVDASASYPLRYAYPTSTNPRTWASFPNGNLIDGVPRPDVLVPLIATSSLNLGDAHTAGESGWMLDAQQHYDPAQRALYSGTGTQRTADDLADVIVRRMVGSGGCCYNGENVAASTAKLSFPAGMKITADGSIYLAEARRVRKVTPDGLVQTIAGNGTCCYSGDGGPATLAQVNIADMAVGPDGAVYIADYSSRLRMVKDGIITTIAGDGSSGVSGDGGPASAAHTSPQGVAVASDGTIYLAEYGGGLIRRITPDGRINSYLPAGITRGLSVGPNDELYFTDFTAGQVYRATREGRVERIAGRSDCGADFIVGDGGKATEACLHGPWYATADRNGTVFVAEQAGARVRAITPDGIIRTVAGNGQTRRARLADVLPATSSVLDAPFGIAVHPNGMVYFTDWDLDVIWRIEPKLPGSTAGGDMLIPSEDGATVSVFRGSRHLRTVDAVTSVTLLSFAYDSEGRLTAVTDVDGNVTTLERNSTGDLTAVVAPNGQRTTVTMTNGLLTAITDPASGKWQFDYYDSGALLKTMTTPRGGSSTFAYDGQGRLNVDADAAGGFQTLTRTGTNRHYIVARTDGEQRRTVSEVSYAADGALTRIVTAPSGEVARSDVGADGTRTFLSADGTHVQSVMGPDARFGMAAPGSSTTTTAIGTHTMTVVRSRMPLLADPANIFSLTSLSETLTRNGRTWANSWSAPSRMIVASSPSGRQVISTLDAKGRTSRIDLPGITPTTMQYDALGLLQSVQQGSRTLAFTYDAQRYLASTTDALQRTTTFTRDALGRVTAETLPGGRTVGFTWDADGDLTSVTPPSRPAHRFAPTPVDLVETYTPPPVPGTGATQYAYNKARQLTLVTRPDGSTLGYSYDNGGRVSAITSPTDAYAFTYTAATGQLASLTLASGASLAYDYEGALLTGVIWSGPVQGRVAYTYDSDLRVASENGIAFTYDADDLLTGAGALTLTRDPGNGAITATQLGAVGETLAYTDFGELASLTASLDGASDPLFSETLARDDVGRIVARDESLLGGTSHDDYAYDDAGRLQSVTHNGTTTTYAYDANGNRTAVVNPSATEGATYDDQDRLLTRGSTTYAYAPNGELQSKTYASGTTSYTYDALGNLRHLVLPSGTVIDYVIDAQSRRVGKKVNGTLVAGWLYGDQLRIVAELDGSGTVVSQFVYASRATVPDAMVRGGITYRILTDHLGSPRMVVDSATGTVAETLSFDAFGNLTGDTNPGLIPFGFAGGLFDRDTGLVRFGARDYDPGAGRWTAKDVLGFAGGEANLYAYAADDPVNLIDPDGLRLYPSAYVGPLRPGDSYYYVASPSDPRYASIYNGTPASQFYYPPGTPENLQRECVSLTKAFSGAPCTACWRMGPAVENNGTIPVGAAIAAGWTSNGRYPAHNGNSGIYVGQDMTGVSIIDQYPHDINGNPHEGSVRVLGFGGGRATVNDGSAYHLITVPPSCGCGR